MKLLSLFQRPQPAVGEKCQKILNYLDNVDDWKNPSTNKLVNELRLLVIEYCAYWKTTWINYKGKFIHENFTDHERNLITKKTKQFLKDLRQQEINKEKKESQEAYNDL